MPRNKRFIKRHTTDFRPCPACGGKGFVLANIGDNDPPAFISVAFNKSPAMETCGECQGTGEIQFH